MTKRKTNSARTTVKAAVSKGSITKSSAAPTTTATPLLIILGFDDQQKPRGARFIDAKPNLVTKAADLMGFKVYDASPPDVAEAAKKLPLGRLYANGRGLCPTFGNRCTATSLWPLHSKARQHWGGMATRAACLSPVACPGRGTTSRLAILSLPRESLEYGWWEAIVLDRKDDSFTLQYRDYPHLPKFVRHRSGIALMSPPTNEANLAAHSEQA